MSEGICRLCCKSDNVLLQVFVDVTEEISLAAKIFVCFGVKIQEDDAITKRICKSCYFFTNSAYEFRISAQQNDVKLKKAYEETLVEDLPAPQTISQDDFLNTLNLANKNNINEKSKARQYHPSVQRVKRKYPHVNIPASCHRINIEPIVFVDRTDIDQWNDELTNLGIWAVNRKKFQNQTGVTLTRVRQKSIDYTESSDTSERSSPAKKKKKKILWCEPKSKSLRFTLRRKPKQFAIPNTSLTTDSEKKSTKNPTEDRREESEDPKNDDCVQPRVTRSSTKFVANVKNTLGEIINFSKEINQRDDSMELNVESDESENLPNLEEIISESLQNMGSNEHANTDSDGNEKHVESMAVQNVQSDDSSTKIDLNQMKISSVQTLSETQVSDEMLPTKYSSDIPVDEHESDSMSAYNDNNLLMAMGQDVTYICQTCNKIFDSMNLLEKHKKYSHRVSLQCYRCSKKFAVVEDQMKHMLEAHSEVHENVTSPIQSYTPSPVTEVLRQPENNGSEISQPANTISVICKIEKTLSAERDSSTPIFEKLPEPSVNPMENPIQLPERTDSTTNTHSKLRELLGNGEGSQNSSQNGVSKKSNQKLLPKYIPPILKRVARKSTAGRRNWKTSDQGAKETEIARNLRMEECVISSDDDDVEITGVIRKIAVIRGNLNEPAVESSLDTVLDTALQAQLEQVPQVNLNETSDIDNTAGGLTDKPLQSPVLTETASKSIRYATVDANVKESNVKLREDQVLLIVESDPEDDSVLFVPNESIHPNSPNAGPSTSSKVGKSKNEDSGFNNEMRQRIMMVSNSRDKRTHTQASANNKITNENSYINYIFNKCRYSDKLSVGEQKWILRDLQPLLNRHYVPVEVELSNVSDVNANYVVPANSLKILTQQAQAYWNFDSAIKLPKKRPAIVDEKSKTKEVEKDTIRNSLNNNVTTSANTSNVPSTYKDPIPTSNTVSLPSTMVTVPCSGQSVSCVNAQDNVSNSFLTNPNTTTASQNHSPEVPTGKGEQINMIYILQSAPSNELALNTTTGAHETKDSTQNDMNQQSPALLASTPQQQKHVLLNGVPYPNYTKFRYGHMDPGQPILFRPFITPPTNVNIQNFVSVNQTNIASTSTDIREQYVNTAPVTQMNPIVSYSASPMSVPPGTSNQSDLTLKDPTTKPSIRIKDLSELTGKAPVNIVDRNLLHGFYSNTVSNYISHSTNNAANSAKGNSADEFMQIS